MITQKNKTFLTIKPKVLYFGTPVALITTIDQNGNSNIGPISSAWALGYNLLLGLGCDSKTYQNLIENRECVVNLPSADLCENIEKIARLTGLNPVPLAKQAQYSHHSDKFAAGNFEPMAAQMVAPLAIANCPIQLECILQHHYVMEYDENGEPLIAAVQVKVIKVRVDENLVVNQNHIDPAAWSPLIYNFRHYYALGKNMGKNFRAE